MGAYIRQISILIFRGAGDNTYHEDPVLEFHIFNGYRREQKRCVLL